MQSALERHLRNAGKKHSILRDREFEKSRQQLKAKARELRVKGYGKRKNASHALNEEDEEFLWQSGQLGNHSAQALVNVNFKNVTEHFGLRGRQERVFLAKLYFLTSYMIIIIMIIIINRSQEARHCNPEEEGKGNNHCRHSCSRR